MMPGPGLCGVIPFTKKLQSFPCSIGTTLAQTLGPAPRIKGAQIFTRPPDGSLESQFCVLCTSTCVTGPAAWGGCHRGTGDLQIWLQFISCVTSDKSLSLFGSWFPRFLTPSFGLGSFPNFTEYQHHLGFVL